MSSHGDVPISTFVWSTEFFNRFDDIVLELFKVTIKFIKSRLGYSPVVNSLNEFDRPAIVLQWKESKRFFLFLPLFCDFHLFRCKRKWKLCFLLTFYEERKKEETTSAQNAKIKSNKQSRRKENGSGSVSFFSLDTYLYRSLCRTLVNSTLHCNFFCIFILFLVVNKMWDRKGTWQFNDVFFLRNLTNSWRPDFSVVLISNEKITKKMSEICQRSTIRTLTFFQWHALRYVVLHFFFFRSVCPSVEKSFCTENK